MAKIITTKVLKNHQGLVVSGQPIQLLEQRYKELVAIGVVEEVETKKKTTTKPKQGAQDADPESNNT